MLRAHAKRSIKGARREAWEHAMDIYHAWFNLKAGVKDVEFADGAKAYFEHLKGERSIAGYRITRRKLGLGHPNLPEWHVTLEFENLAQMDTASRASRRARTPSRAFTTR
jgi:hypothetical protein